MSKKIRLTEEQLKGYIKYLVEAKNTPIATAKVPISIAQQYKSKFAKDNNVPIEYVMYDKEKQLMYISNKPVKKTQKPIIKKREDETNESYINRIFSSNEKFSEQAEKYNSTVWREVTNKNNRYSRVKDNIDGIIEVSPEGYVRYIDTENGNKSCYIIPNFSETRNEMQVHLEQFSCPSLKGMIVDCFPEMVEWKDNARELPVLQTKIINKDGNPKNCSADNLLVRPKKLSDQEKQEKRDFEEKERLRKEKNRINSYNYRHGIETEEKYKKRLEKVKEYQAKRLSDPEKRAQFNLYQKMAARKRRKLKHDNDVANGRVFSGRGSKPKEIDYDILKKGLHEALIKMTNNIY